MTSIKLVKRVNYFFVKMSRSHLERSCSNDGVSYESSKKKRIANNSVTLKDQKVFSKMCADQGCDQSLYATLLNYRLCTNKYLQKFYPFNMKMKKLLNNSLNSSTECLHSPSKHTRSGSYNGCFMEKCRKNSTSESKKKVAFKNIKKQDFSKNVGLVNYLSLNTSTSQNLQSTNDPIPLKSTGVTKNNKLSSNFSSSDVENFNLSQPELTESLSYINLDPEVDQFICTAGGPYPLMLPTTLNDLKRDRTFCQVSLLLSPPLKRSLGKFYLSPNRKNILKGDTTTGTSNEGSTNQKILSQTELKIQNENRGNIQNMPSLATLYEENEDENTRDVEECNKYPSSSLSIKNEISPTIKDTFGWDMNILKKFVDVPEKISINELKTFFDRNAERRAYIIRSEERKCSKGWTNINRYTEKKVKPIPSGCWVQGKDDNKISNNVGSLKFITLKILNISYVEEFNLGIFFENLLLENFILVGNGNTFDFLTHDSTIFNELLSYLLENSSGIKLPYIDEIVNFEIVFQQ
uniref:AAA domain-containing protein n=1 Tax=Strongyloides stercoralis TaxID=6248 RepID=A0A0K0EB66_STRER